MTRAKPYFKLDLQRTGMLPEGWQADIKAVVDTYGIATVLTGEGSTSRESRTGQRMHVRVADGVVVKEHLPWLYALYNGPLKDFCIASFGKPLFTANLIHTAVNINYLAGRGAQYEWHVDSNPVTGLLFVTDSNHNLGGSLVFRVRDSYRSIVRPKAGMFICFDARDIPHRVTPLRRDGTRISIPMNYYDSATVQTRPADLDEQIYSSTDSK
jgi:hypothetical protein